MYLIDTDWIIDYLNDREVIVKEIQEKFGVGLNISIISLAELYEGIYGSENFEENEKELDEFLIGVTVLELTKDICKNFGELRNELRKRGELIGDFDLIIASTALQNNLTLLTDNTKHFKRIKELKIKSS